MDAKQRTHTMKQFQIGKWFYDHNTGVLNNGEEQRNLRAKSNDVLWYFLQHPQQVLSKKDILDTIWDDVHAQEHVLFQSIKEIRQCFGELPVIKTHPRKGYEWIATVNAIAVDHRITDQREKAVEATTENKSSALLPSLASWSFVTAASLLISVCLFIWLQYTTQGAKTAETRHQVATISGATVDTTEKFVELVITPVRLHQQDSLTQWVAIGAMDMLIKKLQQTDIQQSSGGIFVVDTEDVLEANKRAAVYSNDSTEVQSRKLRHAMGNITSLHTELFGSPMEYSLKYQLISRYEIQQGVLSGDTVVALINQLAQQVPTLLNMKATGEYTPFQQEFADNAFILGLTHYYQKEFSLAQQYFQTALNSNAQYPQLRRYLSKSLNAQGKHREAMTMAQTAIDEALNKNNNSEQLRSRFELGTTQWLLGKIPEAKNQIEQTRTLAKNTKDLLYLAFSIEMLGHFAFQEKHLAEARQYFTQSLNYHQGFLCPYGQSTNLINLSRVSRAQGNHNEAEALLNTALITAQNSDLVNFETRIHLLMAQQAKSQNQAAEMASHLQSAQSLVDKHTFPEAQKILDDWPDSAEKIR